MSDKTNSCDKGGEIYSLFIIFRRKSDYVGGGARKYMRSNNAERETRILHKNLFICRLYGSYTDRDVRDAAGSNFGQKSDSPD
jgi:hypothetical protein